MRCARAGSRCRRTEVIAKADAGPDASADSPPTADTPPVAETPPVADTPPVAEVASAAEIATRLRAEAAAVDAEATEIDLLINQAKIEAARHESRRAGAVEKLAMGAERLASGAGMAPKELADLANQLVAVARRAALMEAQVDLLEGKRKSAIRLKEALLNNADQADKLTGAPPPGASHGIGPGPSGAISDVEEGGPLPPGVARMILTAQEDMRREIARQMHDGPAQSLTNIVLQAQIVDRLMTQDPGKAAAEVQQLIAMVQRTLDATKTFIFDVRPMVLDDLGLVPTLRRASRDRGRRAGVNVEFESIGVDRRLPMEIESGLFRMLDDALAAHVAAKPDTLAMHLDWGEHLVIELTAGRQPETVPDPELPPEGTELPPALAAMVEERRKAYDDAVEAARVASLSRLPERAWRDVAGRARILGVRAQMLDDGSRLQLEVDLPNPAGNDLVSVGAQATPS